MQSSSLTVPIRKYDFTTELQCLTFAIKKPTHKGKIKSPYKDWVAILIQLE